MAHTELAKQLQEKEQLVQDLKDTLSTLQQAHDALKISSHEQLLKIARCTAPARKQVKRRNRKK